MAAGSRKQLRAAPPSHSINCEHWGAVHHQGVITDVTSTHAAGTRLVTVADALGYPCGDLVLRTWNQSAPEDGSVEGVMAKRPGSAFGGNYNFREWLGRLLRISPRPVEVLAVDGNDLHISPSRPDICLYGRMVAWAAEAIEPVGRIAGGFRPAGLLSASYPS